MSSKIIKSLAFIALAAGGTVAMAQVSGGGVSGGGVSGVSGVSGGLGIDFAGSQIGGVNVEKDGGFASSVEAAFGNDGASTDANVTKSERRKN